jgi:hypothetical protein
LNSIAHVRGVTNTSKFSTTLTTDPSKFKLKSPLPLQCGCRLLSVTKVLKKSRHFWAKCKKSEILRFRDKSESFSRHLRPGHPRHQWRTETKRYQNI